MLTGNHGFVFFVLAVVVAAASCVYAQSQPESTVEKSPEAGSLNDIVSQMEQAQVKNRQSFRSYTVTREYKLFDDERKAQDPAEKPNSAVVANVEFVPPDHKSFQIEKVEGSERGKSIVEHVLEGEAGKSAKGPASLSRENYDFKLAGEEIVNGRSCWVLNIKPLREEKNTIKGKAWVDKNTYLVQQVQGEMAKTPSWWLKKVAMTVQFGDAAGMWLPTGTYAVADVRFFGRHVLTSQAVEIKTNDQVARSFSSTPRPEAERRRLRAFPQMVGTGVLVHR